MLHIIKLCVGARDLDDLRVWRQARLEEAARSGLPHEFVHHTKQTPKNSEQALNGGSLYWVISGFILARQRLIGIRPEQDETGRVKCGLVLAPEIIATEPRPRRPFQGWRYLKPEDAPPDLPHSPNPDAMPSSMRNELAILGLL